MDNQWKAARIKQDYIRSCADMYQRGECTAGEAMRLCVQEGMSSVDAVQFICGIDIHDDNELAVYLEVRASRYIRAMCHAHEYWPRTEAT